MPGGIWSVNVIYVIYTLTGYVCVYVCMSVYMYACFYVCLCRFKYMYVCICIGICVCIYPEYILHECFDGGSGIAEVTCRGQSSA